MTKKTAIQCLNALQRRVSWYAARRKLPPAALIEALHEVKRILRQHAIESGDL